MAEIFPSLNGATYQLPLTARQVLAANMQDASTVEGAALNNTFVAPQALTDAVAPKLDKAEAAATYVAWAPLPSGTDDTAVLQASISALSSSGGVLRLRRGVYKVSAPLTLSGSVVIQGAGQSATQIIASHAGAVFSTSTPGVRSFTWTITDCLLTGPGSGVTGSVGLDLDSVSSSRFRNITTTGFEIGIRVRSAINGGATYNSFEKVTSQTCGTGYSIEASGSNSTTFFGCRANVCGVVGIQITDSNATVWTGGQIEGCAIGVYFNGTSTALCSNNQVVNTRFEGNTIAWQTSALAVDNLIFSPQIFGTYTINDLGIRTNQISATGLSLYSAFQNASGSWRFTRTANGATEIPAFVVADTNTVTGTPVTILAQTERAAGYPFRAIRGGVTYWDIDAAGNMRMPQGGYTELTERAVAPAAPAANNARLYLIDNGSGKTQLCVLFNTGTPVVIATQA